MFEDRVEEFPRVLGIAVGQELHGALEVGEEDCDLLALPLEGGLRSEDLLGEMLWRVDLGRREARFGRHLLGEGMRALGAELRGGRRLCAALLARPNQRGGALFAELGAGAVLVPAAGALHAGTSECSSP